MTDLDPRNLLTAGAMLTVGAAALPPAMAAEPVVALRSFTAQPLPFDPKTIIGFSEELLVSHHDDNYVGAVKGLGSIATQFAALDPATVLGFTINGLRREKLMA